jgi:hypothetical protein
MYTQTDMGKECPPLPERGVSVYTLSRSGSVRLFIHSETGSRPSEHLASCSRTSLLQRFEDEDQHKSGVEEEEEEEEEDEFFYTSDGVPNVLPFSPLWWGEIEELTCTLMIHMIKPWVFRPIPAHRTS